MGDFFSVRMRASRGGRHISGAERIVPSGEIETAAASLIKRAMSHENGAPEEINITVGSLADKEILMLKPLAVNSPPPLPAPAPTRPAIGGTPSPAGGEGNKEETIIGGGSGLQVRLSHDFAVSELVKAGVSEIAAREALMRIISGASPDGENMRGAMIIDAKTGKRLEPDKTRGVRARAVDWARESEPDILRAEKRLNCVTPHFREALALATKVANAPGAVAELCVSDDPGYVTGYVASLTRGYCRITPMKVAGDPFGGRAFFVDTEKFDINKYLYYMRETPTMVNGIIPITVIPAEAGIQELGCHPEPFDVAQGRLRRRIHS